MDMKKYILIALVFFVVLGGCLYGAYLFYMPKTPAHVAFDPKNATYTIENEQMTVVDGKTASGGIFGKVTRGDVNSDGRDDAVFFWTQSSEGSGTFYYVVAALNTTEGTIGTNAVFVGDRIAPQNITIEAGAIVATYADRAEGEAMTTPPSVGKSLSLVVQHGLLQAVPATDYTFTYITSPEETTAYCNGETMDSAGYRASLTTKHTGTIAKPHPTIQEILRATIDASTTGMCHTVMSETSFTEKDGVVTISPIDAWAGVSIGLCSCKPQVEVNILQIPGIKQVIWSDGTEAHTNSIVLDSPLPQGAVSNPIQLKGKARGSWFFEASFPVVLLDSHENIIGQSIAQAKSDWMTSEFVPFEATIIYTMDTQISGEAGTLVLKKDNPSGLPENDDELRVPVILGK